MALPKTVTKAELARLVNRDVRTITNWQNEGMPVERVKGRPAYPLAACFTWIIDHEREIARAGKGLNELDQIRARKTLAEAQKAELELGQMEGRLLTTEAVEAIVDELCDRLRAPLVNLPGTFGLRLEEAGVPAAAAEAVLEAIATELTKALRGAADELGAAAEEEPGDGDGSQSTAA